MDEKNLTVLLGDPSKSYAALEKGSILTLAQTLELIAKKEAFIPKPTAHERKEYYSSWRDWESRNEVVSLAKQGKPQPLDITKNALIRGVENPFNSEEVLKYRSLPPYIITSDLVILEKKMIN